MALIDRIKHDGPPDELVWKFKSDSIVMGAQLVVNESQEAIFFKGGQALDVFGPGTHTLSTKNLPLLKGLVNIPFGGKTPFAAEIFFVNRTARLSYKWGTSTPIPIEDPKLKVLVNVGCFGQFGLRVTDSRLFVTQIVGTMMAWESREVMNYFRGAILTRVKDTVAKSLLQKNESVLSITANVDEISKLVEERLCEEFAKYGLELLRFFVQSIAIPDEEVKKIQEGGFERLRIEQIGDDRYRMKRSFDVMQDAASNTASAGTFMAAGVGLGVGATMAKPFAEKTQEALNPASQSGTSAPAMTAAILCPQCHSSLALGSRFCSNCGAKVPAPTNCPSCGAILATPANFCLQCGAKLAAPSTCPSCGTSIPAGAKFCQQCGKALG